jgi:phosphoribosylformylglycinamidine synthase
VVRVHGTQKALAMSTDVTPRYCFADPVEGGKQAIAECYRNLSAVGATPLAVTNCLNFANPQRPEIMAQFVGCLQGMSEACRALDFPIVSGNVSLYNESKATGGGSAILPTPAIGGIGLLADWRKSATIAFKAEGEEILLIGRDGDGHLGQSLWLREIIGREDGLPPPVSLDDERKAGDFVRMLIQTGEITAVHDCADGGLLVALAEMALASGIGAILTVDLDAATAFGEDQGRYLATAPAGFYASLVGVPVNVSRIGTTGGTSLAHPGGSVELEELRHAHEAFFPALMGKELAVA